LGCEAFDRAASLSVIPEGKVKWHVRWIRRFAAVLKEKRFMQLNGTML